MAERGAALRGLLESRGPREVEVGGVPGAGSEESEDRTQESCPPNAGSPIAVRVGRAPPPIYVGGSSSDSEGERVSPPLGVPGQPRPKRRRVLCSTEIPTVPVYSNKVNSSFKLCPAELRQEMPTLQWQGEADLDVDEISPVVPPRPERPHAPRLPQGPCPDWLEEESEPQGAVRTVRAESPSPPPPPRPTRRQRGRTHREVERQLRGLSSWLSAAQRSLREEPTEDDVILVEPVPAPAPRQLQLKVRCRAEIHRVPVETCSRSPCRPWWSTWLGGCRCGRRRSCCCCGTWSCPHMTPHRRWAWVWLTSLIVWWMWQQGSSRAAGSQGPGRVPGSYG
ncbi:NFATC2-interacting protein isoform X1 [Emydura macquarii macquarii]|uniref:NFATC2-interacting protein isoform X1 n=1 Tax=Emydura macquarii macquarii TaxID=1129001 RepID=UPI00352B267A